MSVKKLLVNRKEFLKNFISPISRYLKDDSFACFQNLNGHLVFAKQVVSENYRFVYSSKFRVTHTDINEGYRFYVKDIKKLVTALSLIDDEELLLEVTNAHIRIRTKGLNTNFQLYDSNLASKMDKDISRMFELLPDNKNELAIEKEDLVKIKKLLNLSDPKTQVQFINTDGVLNLVCGESRGDLINIKLSENSPFESCKITQGVLRILGETGVKVYQNTKPALVFKEELDYCERLYITSLI